MIAEEKNINISREKDFISVMAWWLAAAFVFWAFYSVFQGFSFTIGYFYVWIGLFGGFLWLKRKKVKEWIGRWPLKPAVKFFVLAYGMVLLEETFAALFNHLSEGFNWRLLFVRIGQFWVFNAIVFSGLIISFYFLASRVQYRVTEAFFLVGFFGLIPERMLPLVFNNPLFFFFSAPLIIFSYGIIITPAFLSLSDGDKMSLPFSFKSTLSLGAMIVGGIISHLVLQSLKGMVPFLFPPAKFFLF